MSSNTIPSAQMDSSSNSSTHDSNHNVSDVLLYAESKMTRKQAVREIADVVLRANMKPRTVKHALQLLKVLLPPENTLPTTVNELFGAMLSSENDWRLAQYLIKHKQQPAFLSGSSITSSPHLWSDYSNSATSLTAASSSSVPANQSLNIPMQSSPLFLPLSNNSSSSSSSSSSNSSSSDSGSDNENSSESSSSSSSSSSSESEADDDDDDDDDEEEDDDDDERNILRVLQEAQQQQRRENASASSSSPSVRPNTASAEVDNSLNRVTSNNHSESSDQRSQIVSSSFNRFPFLGSFKRQRSETSSDESDSETDLFFQTQIQNNHADEDDDDDSDSDDETTFYSIANNNTNTNNTKSRCFEMNGCDLLDGGKRRRHL